jgi:hypothetical protein
MPAVKRERDRENLEANMDVAPLYTFPRSGKKIGLAVWIGLLPVSNVLNSTLVQLLQSPSAASYKMPNGLAKKNVFRKGVLV